MSEEKKQLITEEQLNKVCGGSSSGSSGDGIITKLVNDVSVNYVYWLDSHPDATYKQKREKVAWYMDCLYANYDQKDIDYILWYKATYPNDWENLIDWITDCGFQH